MANRPRRSVTQKFNITYTEEKEEDELDLSDSEGEDEFVPEKLDLSEESDAEVTEQNDFENAAEHLMKRTEKSCSSMSLKEKLSKNNSFLSQFSASTSSTSFQTMGNLSEESESEDDKPILKQPRMNDVQFNSLTENDISNETEEIGENFWEQQMSAITALSEGSLKSEDKSESNINNDVTSILGIGEKMKDTLNLPPSRQAKISSLVPQEGVQISIALPKLKRSKKEKANLQELLRKHLRKEKKELCLNIHKVHICCLIAHGMYLNDILGSEILKASVMSVLPFSAPIKTSFSYVDSLLRWYNKKYFVAKENDKIPRNLEDDLLKRNETKVFYNTVEFVLFFVLILRVGGVDARLVMSLQPARLKVEKEASDNDGKTKKKVKVKNENAVSDTESENDDDFEEVPEIVQEIGNKSSKKGKKSKTKPSSCKKMSIDQTSPYFKSEDDSKKMTEKGGKKFVHRSRGIGKGLQKRNDKEGENNAMKNGTAEDEGPPVLSPQRGISKEDSGNITNGRRKSDRNRKEQSELPILSPQIPSKSHRKLSHDSDDEPLSKRLKVESMSSVPERPLKENLLVSKAKDISKSKKGSQGILKEKVTKEVFKIKKEIVTSKKELKSPLKNEQKSQVKSPNPKAIQNLVKKKMEDNSRKMLSSDEEGTSYKKTCDYWVEAYLEQERKWCPIDILFGKMFCERELESRATQPVQYVLAFNSNGSLKEVTPRYASDWLTQIRKRRIDEAWLEETLSPYKEAESARSRKEDAEIKKMLMEKPIPSSISELKSHPLYALKRHLLKFEAIYPSTIAPMGYIRGEPIFPRDSVYTLHSRETWIRQAKVVRVGEKPYKIVKARPKWDKVLQKTITDKPLEVFGVWQTEDYVPPVAVDGKVPRNEYGNVELYKPTMIPSGCVHLPQMPLLNRVAKKLGIDCAPAMIGWDYHGGSSHPVFDGWIICEEHRDTLLDAWQAAELETEKKEKEKRDKRVFGNWRRLIRGVLIRERLNEKYNLKKNTINS
ncbi:DNA repair protein complementing XP-C cells homolog isoform X2 [Artemia franciscana]|nr:hypothetical protein QYM36_011634 [Artemia franciscana]KAK2712999.1 hypothetical protein QYM36_011634 [Artemia franciscana]KAK2713000.1 hypothetical protein QYM36_011634 [Artemia franciscana]